MTLRELKSKRKARAIKYLVDNGEYSAPYGSMEAERLNDEGLILDEDYIPLANYLDELINRQIAQQQEQEQQEEIIEELPEEIEE